MKYSTASTQRFSDATTRQTQFWRVHKTISVSKQYIKNPNGKLTLSRPKTKTLVRQVSIPQDAVDLLIQEHSKHNAPQRVKSQSD